MKKQGHRNGIFVGKTIKKGEHLSEKTEFKKGIIPWNKGKINNIKKFCKECNKAFYVVISRKDKAKYCSPKCYQKNICGNKNAFWLGGRYEKGKSRGYKLKYVPNHPFCDASGCVKEHRLVMEKHIGRYLTKTERIHHINGIRNDNRIENLKLFSSNSEHMKLHYKK